MYRALSASMIKKRKTQNKTIKPVDGTLTRKIYDDLINNGSYVRTSTRYKTENSIVINLRNFYNMTIITQGNVFVYLG